MTDAEDTRLSAVDHLLDAAQPVESLADDLFAVVDALDASPILRRSLTDPGAPEQARVRLAHALLDGKVSESAVNLVADATKMRWSGGRSFAAALERQAVRAELIRAQQAGQLDETEDALFRFARLVDSTPELRNVLADRAVPLAERQRLVSELLEGRTTESTIRLTRRGVAARERTLGNTLESYLGLAAAQRNRVVATVRVARPLEAGQLKRLRAALSRQAGREVDIQVVVDPEVLGGVRVELGDEVIEGTVANRLDEARRRFS